MTTMENTSGQGSSATVPAEIDRWNWGAFFLNWIWGIGNNTYIALLMFVPFVNFIMMFVLGVKGSAWAWRNKRWDDVEHFRRVQKRWAMWGAAIWVLCFALVFVLVPAMLKSSDAFKLAKQTLDTHEAAVRVLGSPISTGFPMGEVKVSGPRGHASLSFDVDGPKGSGTVYVEASQDMGEWTIDRMVLEVDDTGQRIDLTTGGKVWH